MKRTYKRALAVGSDNNGRFFTLDKDGNPAIQVDIAREIVSAFKLTSGFLKVEITVDDGRKNEYEFNMDAVDVIRTGGVKGIITDRENRKVTILDCGLKKPNFPIVAKVEMNDEDTICFYTKEGNCEDGLEAHKLIIFVLEDTAAPEPPTKSEAASQPRQTPPAAKPQVTPGQEQPATPAPKVKFDEPAPAPAQSAAPAPAAGNDDIFRDIETYINSLKDRTVGKGLSAMEIIEKFRPEWEKHFTFDEIKDNIFRIY